jgi:hypothetical protein
MLRHCEITRIVVEVDVMMRRSGPASKGETYSPVIVLKIGDDEIWCRPRCLNAAATVQQAFDAADQYCLEQIGGQVAGVPHVPPDDVARQLKLDRRLRILRSHDKGLDYGAELRRVGK